DAFELGTRFGPHPDFGVQLSGFATLIERESVFDHVSGLNIELSGTRRFGAELAVRASPLEWLMLRADTTVVHARFVRSGNPVPFAPWLTGSLRAIVTHDCGVSAGVRFMAVAPRPLPHGARGAPLSILDATLGYRFAWLRVDLEVEN